MQIERNHRQKENSRNHKWRTPRGFMLCAVLLLLTACSNGTDDGSSKAPASPVESATKTQAPSAATRPSGDAVAGKVVYERHCHFCHGNSGLGDGPVGMAISPHPADFVHDRKRMKKTDEELFESISEGVKKEVGGEAMNMPEWKGILSEAERWDVLAYIRQLAEEGRAKEVAK